MIAKDPFNSNNDDEKWSENYDDAEDRVAEAIAAKPRRIRDPVQKVALLACLVAVVIADGYKQQYDNYENIDYKFNYDVKDDQHYNYQTRDEYKDGKNVYGSYSLVEPDGTTRVVKYTADDYGFHATVDHQGGYNKPSYGGQSYKQPSYQPSYQQPSYKQQSYQPSYKAPSYQAPSYKAPSYQAPSYKAPSYQAPSYKAPSYQAPSYQAPSYKAPSYQPSYQPSYKAQSYQPSYHQPSYQQSYQQPSYQPAQHYNAHNTYEPHYQTSYTTGGQY